MALKEWHKVLIAFVITYIVLFALQALLSGIGILGAWANNPSFYLLAIPGFFLAFFATEWIEGFFETGIVKKSWFVILILVLALLAWWMALAFYFQNNIALELKSNQTYINGGELQFSAGCKIPALAEGAKRNSTMDSFGMAGCLAGEQFLDQLKNSPYLIFILAAIAGWASSIAITGKKK